MTGNNDSQFIGAIGPGNGAGGRWAAQSLSQFTVGDGLPGQDISQFDPYRGGEITAVPGDGYPEVSAVAGEVGIKFAFRLCQDVILPGCDGGGMSLGQAF